MTGTLLTATFRDPAPALAAWRDLRTDTGAELHSPFPIGELDRDECSTGPAWISGLTGISALAAFVGAIAFQWWTATQAYPIDIGGRTANLLAYVPAAIAVAMLAAAVVATGSFLRLAGLPRLHHAFFEGEAGRSVAEGSYVVTLMTETPDIIEPRLRSHGATGVERHEIADG